MKYTIHPSDLYWKVYKVHYIGQEYVKLCMEAFYKSNNLPCNWIPRKNYKVIRSVYDNWQIYSN